MFRRKSGLEKFLIWLKNCGLMIFDCVLIFILLLHIICFWQQVQPVCSAKCDKDVSLKLKIDFLFTNFDQIKKKALFLPDGSLKGYLFGLDYHLNINICLISKQIINYQILTTLVFGKPHATAYLSLENS